MRPHRELAVELQIRTELPILHREACAKQARRQRAGRRNVNRPAVQRGALPQFGGEKLIVERIMYNAGYQLVSLGQSDGHAKARITMREVRRAVQRIDVPAKVGLLLASRAFFSSNRMPRE